ncbi:MAG: hypothetical protein ACP5GH_03885 [Nitrososphaeria archaeon]
MSGNIIASGMVGERLLQMVKKSGWRPSKTYVVFGLGKQLVDEGISGAVYVGVLPFESEREARFRAVSQIRRILMNGSPLIIFESDAYEELMSKRSYSDIYNVIAEEVFAVIKAIDAEDQSILALLKDPVVAIPLDDEEGVPRFAYNLYKLVKKIGNFQVLLLGDGVSPSASQSIYERLSNLGFSFSVSISKSGGLITGLVEGELSIMEADPVSRILGNRVLDLDPEEKVEVSLPYLDRID